jgi:sugar O-acyltransferase (sialic acid O-acetyltransferase NeuD family)
MSTDAILMFGAGGHAAVVLDAFLLAGGDASGLFLCDDDMAKHGLALMGRTIGPLPGGRIEGRGFHVAIGANAAREAAFQCLLAAGAVPHSIIHPRAVVSPHASVADGAFIAALALLAPFCSVGEGVIINHAAIVDHDCMIAPFSHVGPGASLAGGVRVGHGVLIGAGARILPGVDIGDRARIGAGAVVRSNVEAGALHVGVPARKVG